MAKERTCNVPGCGKTRIIGRGLCGRHYSRAKYGKAANPLVVEARKYMSPRARRAPGTARPAAGPAAKAPKAAGRRSLAASMAEVSRLAGRIDAEASGLIGDCQAAIGAVQSVAARVNDRNRTLLKSLVASRRQMQRLAQKDQ